MNIDISIFCIKKQFPNRNNMSQEKRPPPLSAPTTARLGQAQEIYPLCQFSDNPIKTGIRSIVKSPGLICQQPPIDVEVQVILPEWPQRAVLYSGRHSISDVHQTSRECATASEDVYLVCI